MTQIATAVYALIILGLFWLDRDRKVHTSSALWLPVAWLLLACSRSVNQWLDIGQATGGISSADQQYVIEGNPIDRAVYGALVVFGTIVLVRRRRQVGKLLWANLPIVLFFFYCVLSLLWSDYPDVAFKRWTKAIGDLVMVLIVLSDRQPLEAVKRFLARAGFVLIPLSVLFIKYYPDLGRGYGRWDYQTFYTGITTNKNTLGVICLFFGLACVWRLLTMYRDRKRGLRFSHLTAHGIIVAMVLWLFWIANSMTSLSCFLIGSVLLVAANLRAVIRRPALLHALVAVMILGSVATLFWGVGSGFVKDTMARDTSTLTDRTNVWKLALSVAGNPLVGTGFESFWLGPRLETMWRGFTWEPSEAHDGYLEVYLNLGWIGVGLLAIVLVTGYRRVIAAFRRHSPLSSLWMTFFVVGVIYNFTEAAFFRMMAPAWIFFLLAIASASVPTRLKASNGAPRWTPKLLPDELPKTQRASMLLS
jgi:exopolysaccharide production protein ExoQ